MKVWQAVCRAGQDTEEGTQSNHSNHVLKHHSWRVGARLWTAFERCQITYVNDSLGTIMVAGMTAAGDLFTARANSRKEVVEAAIRHEALDAN